MPFILGPYAMQCIALTQGYSDLCHGFETFLNHSAFGLHNPFDHCTNIGKIFMPLGKFARDDLPA
jgi:hypothetical protein